MSKEPETPEDIITGHCHKCDQSGLLYWVYNKETEVEQQLCWLCKDRMERA